MNIKHRALLSKKKVLFSSEKRSNLEGLDRLQYYWHNLRTTEKSFSIRQNDVGKIMVWRGFSASQKTKLAILKGFQDSKKYLQTLQNTSLSFATANHEGWILQQDKASLHTFTVTKICFCANSVERLSWSARSFDLNAMEYF